MSQRELSSSKIIFADILGSRPPRTYSRKGKDREAVTVLPALKPTLQDPRRKPSSDPTGLRAAKKIWRDVSTQSRSRTAASPDPIQVGEAKRATQAERMAETIHADKEEYADVNHDGNSRFLPEHSNLEEESSGEDGEKSRSRHIAPRCLSSSRSQRSPKVQHSVEDSDDSCQEDQIETDKIMNAEQKDKKMLPTPVSYHDHRRRPGRPYLHQAKGVRRRPYLIFSQTPSHRLKQLPKSEKKKTIFDSRPNLGDGFSDGEAKHSGLVTLTRNGKQLATGPSFEPLDVTQSKSQASKSPVKKADLINKRKVRRANIEDHSFELPLKKQKKDMQGEISKGVHPETRQPQSQIAGIPSSQRTIVNSSVLDIPEEDEQRGQELPAVIKEMFPVDITRQHDPKDLSEANERIIINTQEEPHLSSDSSVQLIIPNSDIAPDSYRSHQTQHEDPSNSWETYIPNSSSNTRARSVPALSSSSPWKQTSQSPQKRPSSFVEGTDIPRTTFARTLRRVNTQ